MQSFFGKCGQSKKKMTTFARFDFNFAKNNQK